MNLIRRLIGAVIFALCLNGAAADSVVASASSIEQAHQLTLSRERLAAAEVLKSAIDEIKNADSINQEALEKHKRALVRISRVFYGQNAQKEFELAESLYFSKNPRSLSHYEQALRLEPKNVTILIGLMRDLLSREECRRALEVYEQISEMSPYDIEVRYFHWLALLCQEKGGAPQISRDLLEDEEVGPFAQIAHLHWKTLNDMELNKENILDIQRRLKDFPEAYYYLHLIAKEDEIINLDFARRYLELCRRSGSAERRRFNLIPHLCRHKNELEADIRAMEGGQ